MVSGIQEYARRIRELRVQFGWNICSGQLLKDLATSLDPGTVHDLYQQARPDSYVLLGLEQDRDAACKGR